MITTRHIRHDWPEWIDWNNQKTVKSMCGVRTQPHLAGIPGITKQEAVVEVNGKRVWGWCTPCVKNTWPYYMPPALTVDVTSPEILGLHVMARACLAQQYHFIVARDLQRAVRDGDRSGFAKVRLEMLADLEEMFNWLPQTLKGEPLKV